MQTSDNKQGLFFVQLNLVAGTRVGKRCVEPFVKRFDRVKYLGQDKVEKGPKFGKIVLQGSTSENEAITRMIVGGESLSQLGLGILHAMTLVCMARH